MPEFAFQEAAQSIPHDNPHFSPIGQELVKQLEEASLALLARLPRKPQDDDREEKSDYPHERVLRISDHPLLLAQVSLDARFITEQDAQGLVISRGFIQKAAGSCALNQTIFYMGREVVLPERGWPGTELAYSREEFIVLDGIELDGKAATQIRHGEYHINHDGLPNPLLPVVESALPDTDLEVLEAVRDSMHDRREVQLPDPHTRLLMSMNAIKAMLRAA